jgi:spore germination protein KC
MKMKGRIKYIILLIIIVFFTSGCWNSRDLTEMSIVGSIGIDYDNSTEEFILYAEIFNPKKSSSGTSSAVSSGESPTTIYKESAKTIHVALRKIISVSPKKLYIGHMNIVVISEEIAKNHMVEYLDFLFRDPESRKDFVLLVAKDASPFEVLSILPPLETVNSTNIYQKIMANDKNLSSSIKITYDEFISMTLQQGIESISPVVKIVKQDKNYDNTNNVDNTYSTANVVVEEIAIFKDNKLLGYFDDNESIGYNIIVNKLLEGAIPFPCDSNENYGTLEVTKAITKLKVDKNKHVKLDIKIKGAISELNCNIELNKSKNIKKLEKIANKTIKEIVSKTVDTLQNKYKSDNFGFGKYLFHNEYKYWKTIKKDWNEKIFPKLDVKYKIDVTFERKGSAVTSIMEKINDTEE